MNTGAQMVFAACRQAGMPVVCAEFTSLIKDYDFEKHDGLGPYWDGAKLWVAPKHDAADVLHELAHWIEAPSGLREEPNFGLGELSVDTKARLDTYFPDRDSNDDRERRAQLIERGLRIALEGMVAEVELMLKGLRW